MQELKQQVHDFWDAMSCGEVYMSGEEEAQQLAHQAKTRYVLEPYILDFARFGDAAQKDALEIGVGMGADHLELAKAHPKSLSGIDLTARAVEFTKKRLGYYGFNSNIKVSDAENLPFEDNSFDFVYSWGVLHHTPNTPKAILEVYRVLRPGGVARIMIYHKYAIVGYMLWVRYALLSGRLSRSLNDIYSEHLESPGTKAYTVAEARTMFTKFSKVDMRVQLSFGDLLEGEVGQKHSTGLVKLAKSVWPRWLIRSVFANHGLGLLIEARK